MTKEAVIEHIVAIINQLPEDKAVEIARFADLIMESNNKLLQVNAQLQKMRDLLTDQLTEMNAKGAATHFTEAPTFHIKA